MFHQQLWPDPRKHIQRIETGHEPLGATATDCRPRVRRPVLEAHLLNTEDVLYQTVDDLPAGGQQRARRLEHDLGAVLFVLLWFEELWEGGGE